MSNDNRILRDVLVKLVREPSSALLGFRVLGDLCATWLRRPVNAFGLLGTLPSTAAGMEYARTWRAPGAGSDVKSLPARPEEPNPLWQAFEAHREGRGVSKWKHYFEIYHRHFSRFVGQPVHVLEIGVASGGSLELWGGYFGKQCRIYGVDVREECRQFQSDTAQIFIGDQADRAFWKQFKEQVPQVDILIDDGGHTPEQQIVTLEEMLPHLRPGGVYLCEGIWRVHNRFAAYFNGLTRSHHFLNWQPSEMGLPSSFQEAIHSFHVYPYAVVIEKTRARTEPFTAPKRGSVWLPPK